MYPLNLEEWVTWQPLIPLWKLRIFGNSSFNDEVLSFIRENIFKEIVIYATLLIILYQLLFLIVILLLGVFLYNFFF